MDYHYLIESPIHIIDLIRDEINSNIYDRETGLFLVGLIALINKLQKSDDSIVITAAKSNSTTTHLACRTLFSQLPSENIIKVIREYNKNNKTKILGDLNTLERWLLKRYSEANIQWHNDIKILSKIKK